MTAAQALAAAAGMGVDRLDAQLLLLQALGRESAGRGWLLANDQEQIDEPLQHQYLRLCRRRSGGEPLAYIAGHREFHGLDLRVDARVLVPRPDTETLVDWALELCDPDRALRVLDLGTGSGAIALAIKARRPKARVTATDRLPQALEVAGANARTLGLELDLRQANWLQGIAQRFDLIVSNPPYVAAGDPHLAALAHEPISALVAGADGLDDLRTIISQAPACLDPGGWLLLEHGHDQAVAVRSLLAEGGFRQLGNRRDLAGIVRCGGGQWLELG